MFAIQFRKRWAASLAGALIAAGPGLAAAAVFPSGPASNYAFPDGAHGFAFATHGGVVNPGVLVGFNPQPDPPGTPPTMVDLTNAARPLFSNSTGGAYSLEFSITGLGAGQIPLPAAPNADGITGFETTLGGHIFDVGLHFGPGPVDPGSWVGFNPQPDPPGDFGAADFQFKGDPWMSLSLREDGAPLTLSLVPEPATWAMLMLGVAMIGFAARRRRAIPSPLAGEG